MMCSLFLNQYHHGDMREAIPFSIYMVVCLVSLLSWLVKPFVVKKNSHFKNMKEYKIIKQ